MSETKILKEYNYRPITLDKGYANRTLYINLSNNLISEKPVTEIMKEKFIGGKGFGLKLLWEATRPDTKWNDPENEIIISPGPLAGITQYSGAGKSLVVSLSPLTDIVIDSNVGGYFGPFMKFCGFDALEIQGKATNDIIIFIDGTKNKITIEAAPATSSDSHLLAHSLTKKYADDEADMKNISIVSAGTGAENTLFGLLNFSMWDIQRKDVRFKQAGRGGIGTVFRDKRIKALVVKSSGIKGDMNNVVDMKAIIERGQRLGQEVKNLDDSQCQMRKVGTAHLVEVMNDYDLLPTNNSKYGNHKDIANIHSDVWKKKFTPRTSDACWYGCALQCSKTVEGFTVTTGPYQGNKVLVDGPEYESVAGLGSNCGIFDADTILELNFYCDTYGIDTISFGTSVAFAMECYQNNIINKDITGGLELNFGNRQNALELIHQMSRGEGFGKIVGMGVRKMKEHFVKNYGADPEFLQDIGMENKGLEYSEYVSKESLAQQGGYAMTNKGPQHDEAWLIFMDMVNNQIPTFDDKAEALHYFPMFRTWFGLMGLCKLPWNDIQPANNGETDEPAKIPEHVDNYITIFNAVTGKKIDKTEMIRQSERVYNYQRIFNIRRGHGLRQDDAQPYRAAGPVTLEEYESRAERYDKQLKEIIGEGPAGKTTKEKIALLRKYREGQYEKLLDAVYQRRGWTPNGVPTIEHLKKLKMDLPELIDTVRPHL